MVEILSLSLKMGLHHLYNLSSFVTKKKIKWSRKNSFPYALGDRKIQP